jgi:hypothetical protein
VLDWVKQALAVAHSGPGPFASSVAPCSRRAVRRPTATAGPPASAAPSRQRDGRRPWTAKVLTTTDAPEGGVLAGIERALADAGLPPGRLRLVILGATLATNALIDMGGTTAKICFVGGGAPRESRSFEVARVSGRHLRRVGVRHQRAQVLHGRLHDLRGALPDGAGHPQQCRLAVHRAGDGARGVHPERAVPASGGGALGRGPDAPGRRPRLPRPGPARRRPRRGHLLPLERAALGRADALAIRICRPGIAGAGRAPASLPPAFTTERGTGLLDTVMVSPGRQGSGPVSTAAPCGGAHGSSSTVPRCGDGALLGIELESKSVAEKRPEPSRGRRRAQALASGR